LISFTKDFHPLAPEQLAEANAEFRKLIALFTRVTLLADLFSAYTHGRSALNLLPNLTGSDGASVLADLGALHRACIWENITLKADLTKRGLLPGRTVDMTTTSSTSDSPTATQADNNATNAQTAELLGETGTIAAVPGLEQLAQEQKGKEETKKESPAQRNAKALKHIVAEIPTALTPFFQGMFCLFYFERGGDIDVFWVFSCCEVAVDV